MADLTKFIVHMNFYDRVIFYICIILQIFSTFMNILIINVIKYNNKQDRPFIKRPKLLMLNVAIASIILVLGFISLFLIIIPTLQNNLVYMFVLRGIGKYIILTTAYVTSFTIMILSCDMYYSLIRVFNNPLNKFSIKTWVCII